MTVNRCPSSTAPNSTISTGIVEFISCALDAVVVCRPRYTIKLKATMPARDTRKSCQRHSQYRLMSRRMAAQPNGSKNTNAIKCLAKANVIGGTSPLAALPTTKLPAQMSGGRISTSWTRGCALSSFARCDSEPVCITPRRKRHFPTLRLWIAQPDHLLIAFRGSAKIGNPIARNKVC